MEYRGKKAHRIAHAMQGDIIRRIKEECETPSHAPQIKEWSGATTLRHCDREAK